MRTPINPYKILGIPNNASESDIKRAYRKAALENHPDRNRDRPTEAEANMAIINGAYFVLKDEERKRQYDYLYKYGGIGDDEQEDSHDGKVATQNFQHDAGKHHFRGVPHRVPPILIIPANQRRQQSQSASSFSFSSTRQSTNANGVQILITKYTRYQNGWKETHIETATVGADGNNTVYKTETKREKAEIQSVKDFFSSLFGKKNNNVSTLNEKKSTEADAKMQNGGNWFQVLVDQVKKCTGA